MKRLLWLDALKGIGIILILISHSFVIPYLESFLNACFIPLFFISTGYTYRKKEVNKFFIDKINRLLIPYFFYGCVLIVLIAILKCLQGANIFVNISSGIKGLLYSRYCLYPRTVKENMRFFENELSPLWYLTAAFVTSFIFQFIPKSTYKKIMLSSIVCIIITIELSYLPVLLPWSLDTAFMGAVFMLYGSSIRRIDWEKYTQKKLITYNIVNLILYILLVYVNPQINISVREYGNMGIFSILITMLIGILGTNSYGLFCKLFEKTCVIKQLALIGKNTILLLALHRIIFSVVDRIALKSSNNHYIVGLLEVLISLFICQLVRKFLMRISADTIWVKYLFDDMGRNYDLFNLKVK